MNKLSTGSYICSLSTLSCIDIRLLISLDSLIRRACFILAFLSSIVATVFWVSGFNLPLKARAVVSERKYFYAENSSCRDFKYTLIFEPSYEKTGLLGFRQGLTQSRLYQPQKMAGGLNFHI